MRRFLAIFYPPAEYNKINCTVQIENETFFANGKVCINKGYLEVLKPEKKDEKSTNKDENVDKEDEDNKEEGNNLEILKNLKKGQIVLVKNFEIKDAETSPPTRYNSFF